MVSTSVLYLGSPLHKRNVFINKSFGRYLGGFGMDLS